MMDLTSMPLIFISLLGSPEFERSEIVVQTQSGDHRLSVEIADEPLEHVTGLMGREQLDVGQGMLFLYEQDTKVQFWMKHVAFPLDMLFIDRCGFIIQIKSDAQPGDPEKIVPDVSVRAVLEMAGGASKHAQIGVGDQVKLPDQVVPDAGCKL